MTECRTCELLARRDAGDAPVWDSIVRSRAWDVVHCDSTAILGWIVLVVRRHVPAVAELTDDEAAALGPLVRDVSRALHDLLHCQKTYVAQFAESTVHRHVHVHVVPKDACLPEQYLGPGVFQLLGVPEEERVPEQEMNQLATRLRTLLSGYSDEQTSLG
ncbi:MAG TPA: HIT domain-containing protein [Acidimicrobiales bacterium]|nr:HIT domain-containing protein [Acidimicrobiales bacterium]